VRWPSGAQTARDPYEAASRDRRLPYPVALVKGPIYDRPNTQRTIGLTRERRKLAAIVALDAVGYSRLMERDESRTLAMLTEHRIERLEPALAHHGGRLIKLIGDGALLEFASVVDALNAAIEFQRAMSPTNGSRSGSVFTSAMSSLTGMISMAMA